MEIVLTIAGSDPSGGAGIQQDLKTITALGCYGATVITSVTSQNTLGVQASMPVPPDVVFSQLCSVLSDLEPHAVKIGMIPNQTVAEVIVEALRTCRVPVVYDPVMISTSGYPLMHPDAITYITRQLFPLCTLITPNLPEAQSLLEGIIDEHVPSDDVQQAGIVLSHHYATAFLLKGGHADSSQMTDWLFGADGTVSQFSTRKIHSSNLHGTGCTLSSAIASCLAKGASLSDAVKQAKQYLTDAIRRSVTIHIGHGHGPLLPPIGDKF